MGGRKVVADATYLRESILNSGAKIVAGYDNLMPSFQTQMGENDVQGLIASIDLHDDPCGMFAVFASPIGMRQEVGPGPEKEFHRPSAGCRTPVVGHFD